MTDDSDRPISQLMSRLGLTAVSLDAPTRTDDDAGAVQPDAETMSAPPPSFASFFGIFKHKALTLPTLVSVRQCSPPWHQRQKQSPKQRPGPKDNTY